MANLSQEPLSQHEAVTAAREIAAITRTILAGDVEPWAPEVQAKALTLLVRIESRVDPLIDALEDCLVNILTCDGAPWDTPMEAFAEGLDALEEALHVAEDRNKG